MANDRWALVLCLLAGYKPFRDEVGGFMETQGALTEDIRGAEENAKFKALYFMALSKSSVVVGWKTSSIRRQHELPKKEDFVDDVRYPHVVYVEKPKARDVDFSDEMIYQAKTTSEMEEVMLKSLNRIPWERVDVSFKRSRQWIFAHSTIQVKTYFLNSDGADVIFHMIDHFLY
uniref:Uncharacterized protein n=1 Tax=Aegilops tauschii TaxID=37682 RepID=M8ALZ6_AEGTA